MNENQETENLSGQLLDGRYELQEIIGEGGMAVVYRATDHRLNRPVAVKIMRREMIGDEEFRSRFCAESHAVAMLSNPNIVAVYDVSHSDENEYIVMELVDGITLKQYMEKKGPLPWREALHFTKQIARALGQAHERGIIHRDIKPQNIMLLRDGTIKVADFGIAALENEIHESNGEAIGSIHYIAPEQARGLLPDTRSDLYSLGVVMYEMLTGQLPYTGETLGEIAIKHMNADPVPPRQIIPEIPEELETVTLKAMCADMERRYQNAGELLQDLDTFTQNRLRQQEEEAEKLETPEVAPIRSSSELSRDSYRRRRRRSGRVSFLAGTFGVLVTAIALFVFLWNFWLRDIFAPAERIFLPNFVGSNYDSLINDPTIRSLYHFEVMFVVNDTAQPGEVLAQSPNAGRSMMVTPEKIDVHLTVSTNDSMTQVPNVINMDYRSASAVLRQSGFNVELVNEVSDSFTKDYVISSSPEAGTEISMGSTVYLNVSTGPDLLYVNMPNLIGLSENAAIAQMEMYSLSYGGSTYEQAELPAGTVIGQSIEAFTTTEEHSKVILRVSLGPEG